MFMKINVLFKGMHKAYTSTKKINYYINTMSFYGRTVCKDNFKIHLLNLLLSVQQSHSIWLLKNTGRPQYWVTSDSFLHLLFIPCEVLDCTLYNAEADFLIRLCILKFILQLKFPGTACIAWLFFFFQEILCKLLIFQYLCHHYS